MTANAVAGVNRIVIAVRDLEASKRYYEQALGARFHEANWTGAPFGIDVAISWNAGIELVAPTRGREHDCVIAPFLQRRGEGVVSVAFNFANADKAKDSAVAAGFTTSHSLDFSQAEIDSHLGAFFSKYEEHFLESAERCGFGMILAQIVPKSGVNPVLI